MEKEKDINVLVLGQNIIPDLIKESGLHIYLNSSTFLELCSSFNDKKFSIIFEAPPLSKKNEKLISLILNKRNYDICIFVYNLNSKEKIKNLESFSYYNIKDLEQFIKVKCTNLFKAFIGARDIELEEEIKEEYVKKNC